MKTLQHHNRILCGYRRRVGTTLLESLVVITMVSMILTSVIIIALQGSRVYRRTNAVLTPQFNQLLAFQRMERELREAYSIKLTSNATSLEITPPRKSTGKVKVIDVQQSTDDSLTPLPESYTVRYFLGTLVNNEARPDANGDIIFRVPSTVTINSAGNYPLTGSVSNYIIMRNIALLDGDALFAYEPGGATPTSQTRLVVVTLNTPVREGNSRTPFTYQRLTTQFAMRNLQGL